MIEEGAKRKIDELKYSCMNMENNYHDWMIALKTFRKILRICDDDEEVNEYIQDCIEEIEQYLWNKEERERDCKQGNL